VSDTASGTSGGPGVRTVNGVVVPEPGTYKIDPAHTTVGFMARHMMVAKVRGRFTSYKGSVVIAEDPTESSMEVSIDTASIDTREADRDNHLKSPDFFDVENNPTMTYKSTKVTHVEGNDWEVEGDLTIGGVTRPVTLDVEFEGSGTNPWGANVYGFSATAEINREDFDLKWNVALETGGWLVSKKVTIEIEAELQPEG
jgi:polyisoprenoid-binding protein YceI